MTLAQALAHAQSLGLARLDSQMLLLHVLGQPSHQRAWLLAHDADTLAAPVHQRFLALVQRRSSGEPVAYLLGEKEFFGLTLRVDRRVLVPRPDTETLVTWTLELPLASQARIIDLGTGSGAIALALKHARPAWQVSALDASTQALAVAQANAAHLALEVRFIQGHWLNGMGSQPAHDRFDAIVSNPPYIESGDAHLSALVHEPLGALVSGADGLDDIRQIIGQASACLQAGGWLLLEHGYQQASAVRALLAAAGFVHVQSRRDLAGIERCSGGQYPGLADMRPDAQHAGMGYDPHASGQ